MSAWVCTTCTAVYAVGAPCCPQCGDTAHVEQGEDMPKITVHGGPSYAGDVTPEQEGGEQPSPGNSSSPSETKQQQNEKPSKPEAPSPAQTTENPSGKGQTGGSTARSTGGAPKAADKK